MARCEVAIREVIGDVVAIGYNGTCTHREREVRKATSVDLAGSLPGSGTDQVKL